MLCVLGKNIKLNKEKKNLVKNTFKEFSQISGCTRQDAFGWHCSQFHKKAPSQVPTVPVMDMLCAPLGVHRHHSLLRNFA